jgi:hypothetical protein
MQKGVVTAYSWLSWHLLSGCDENLSQDSLQTMILTQDLPDVKQKHYTLDHSVCKQERLITLQRNDKSSLQQ